MNDNYGKKTYTQNKLFSARGRFLKVLSGGEKADWKYTLAIFETDNRENFSIFITDKKIKLLSFYDIEYTNNTNSKYNSKKLISLAISEPKNDEEFERVLINTVKGVGKRTIEILKEKFGSDWAKKFKQEPMLFESSVSPKLFESLKEFFVSYDDETYSFFVNNGLERLYDVLKIEFGEEDLLKKLREINPYSLVYDYDYKFEIIDKLGICMDLDESDKRLYALIYNNVTKLMNNNSTLVDFIELYDAIKKDRKSYSETTLIEAIQKLVNESILFFDTTQNRISTAKMLIKEKYIADELLRLNKYKNNNSVTQTSSVLSPLQQEAFINGVNKKVSVISGFPGTGKSYVIKYLINYFVDNKIYKKSEIAVVAPTGRAAINLKNKLDIEAKTIHSLFRIAQEPFKNIQLASYKDLDHKVLIIDEFSMVTVDLLFLILNNLPRLEKIIFVGDADQLPCIGPGNMLEDIVKSGKIATTILTDIFRTDKKEICDHFLSIKNKKTPSLKTESIKWHEISETEFTEKIVEQYQLSVEKYGIENVAVLIPIHKSEVGIKAVNDILQQWNLLRNQLKKKNIDSISYGHGDTCRLYYVGDRVVQLENDYELDVYNGEIGTITKINANTEVTVDFGYKSITYTREEFGSYVSLGYALSVHKFQGSESMCVILPVFDAYDWMMTTKLMYTGTSRAKEELIIIGNLNFYIWKIKNNNRDIKAYTSFGAFIEKGE
ncbi:AAA family ATPase [Mycoplasma sp. ES3157-GEN-MYC]|uniref:AAA family ATPase n=1 Tax=Mycoplasma miroungigenitalium TaxID=754515 RepID=A0A6M4JFR3_9MOLU|nr:AAA family ATPase [Mycoplasma miroungigenitalium]MBU4690446.1 AAA family ATPase [Mycoplasma miroungigenitalium]MBU4691713.1 AAA family ATPase [Mycoplasma miroungigenitalium]QJR43541.1 AAA family ATPase [Mycoplasma miroungigenitalium]